MNNEVENLINLYFDGELEKGNEPILFTLLSQDEEARSYFKRANALKNNIAYSMDEVPFNLEKKILYTVADKNSKQSFQINKINLFAFASFAVAVIFIVISIFLFIQTGDYKSTLQTVSKQIESQKEEIQLLINSLPAAEVTTKFENPVTVKASL